VHDGDPAAAYDWTTHRSAEVRAIGYDFDGHYRWHYPPPALLFAPRGLRRRGQRQ
jgi:arabinofuranan 3-O-arabinosyltransferase